MTASDLAPVVLVCQNRSCRKAGAAKVLAMFQSRLLFSSMVQGCGCLGHCGNGPTVLVLPDQVWYYKVHPDQVAIIAERHFPQLR
jgi:(2Fe-2S) ferredoxin